MYINASVIISSAFTEERLNWPVPFVFEQSKIVFV
jgi:hypothetical protein